MTRRRSGNRAAAGRVLGALLGGGLLGAVVALLLQAAMLRTATPLPADRAFWQLLLLCVAGALAGFALSTVSALQGANPDPEYHQPRRPQRPSSRRRTAGSD